VKPRSAAASRPPGEVRITAGALRGRKLPVADRPGLRPTPERVRITLFNWLGQDLTGWRVLDAFAGSGSLGLEAASRGAGPVVLLERDPQLLASLEATRLRLGAAATRVQRADALAWMRAAAPASFDLVLLDPPFDADLARPAAEAAVRLVGEGGFVYVESAAPLEPLPAGLLPWRSARAGAVSFQLLRVGYTANEANQRNEP
jgi:16S rRNA (guanine(966)-N(2))-methyltransferase RsmD